MIGIDTNILIRYLIRNDEQKQYSRKSGSMAPNRLSGILGWGSQSDSLRPTAIAHRDTEQIYLQFSPSLR